MQSPARRATAPAAVLAGVLACLLAATALRPLTVPDEGRYADVARAMLRAGDWVTPRLDGVPFLDKPPLFYWLEASSFAAFGVHVWSARLVPALLGFLGCALVLAAGSRLYGRRAGVLAAVVLAANPYYFVASEYVNHDLAVATWISAALLLYALGERSEGARRRWLLAGAWAACGLAVMTKGLIGLVLPLGVVGLWIALRWRWRELGRAAIPLGILLVAAIALPWHLVARRENPDLLHYLYVVQHFQRYAATGFNNPKGAWFYPAILAGGLLPWTPLLPGALARAWRSWRADREGARADLLLLLWPAVVVAFFSLPASKIAGYALPALPPLALLVGRHLDALASEDALAGGEGARPPALRASAALAALFGLALVALPFAPGVPPLPRGLQALSLAAGAVALACAAVAWRAPPLRAAGALALSVAALAAVGLPAVPHFTRDDTVALAARLRPLLREGDVVATYRRWYYDLPVYLDLREPIVVANDWDDPTILRGDHWQSELLLGRMRDPRGEAWLVPYRRLGERCRAAPRCFVVAPRRWLEAARAETGLATLAEANGNFLLGPGALSASAEPGPAAAAR